MVFTICQPRNEVAARTREAGGEQTQPRPVTAHGQTEKKESEHHVCRQMRNVSVQPRGGEQSPPFAVRQRGSVHHAR